MNPVVSLHYFAPSCRDTTSHVPSLALLICFILRSAVPSFNSSSSSYSCTFLPHSPSHTTTLLRAALQATLSSPSRQTEPAKEASRNLLQGLEESVGKIRVAAVAREAASCEEGGGVGREGDCEGRGEGGDAAGGSAGGGSVRGSVEVPFVCAFQMPGNKRVVSTPALWEVLSSLPTALFLLVVRKRCCCLFSAVDGARPLVCSDQPTRDICTNTQVCSCYVHMDLCMQARITPSRNFTSIRLQGNTCKFHASLGLIACLGSLFSLPWSAQLATPGWHAPEYLEHLEPRA